MKDQEISAQIVDKYWKKSGFTEPNPYLLEADIAQALRSVRQAENEACAKVAEKAGCESCASEYGGPLSDGNIDYTEVSKAIRQRMKESK